MKKGKRTFVCMSLLGVLCYWRGRSRRCLKWSKGLPKDVVYLQFVFINGLLVAVEQAGLVGGLLFADDFVGVSESGEQLQRVSSLLL